MVHRIIYNFLIPPVLVFVLARARRHCEWICLNADLAFLDTACPAATATATATTTTATSTTTTTAATTT